VVCSIKRSAADGDNVNEQSQAAAAPMELDFSAEAIDAMVIQLDAAFQMAGDKMPDYVKLSGRDFISKLNMWSDEKKKAAQ